MARQRRLYLICYDIAEDPKRLSRVARYLGKFAWWVQYSVFVGSFFEHSLEGGAARGGGWRNTSRNASAPTLSFSACKSSAVP